MPASTNRVVTPQYEPFMARSCCQETGVGSEARAAGAVEMRRPSEGGVAVDASGITAIMIVLLLGEHGWTASPGTVDCQQVGPALFS
ncbi:hypothetical protein ADK86_12510 [Streptomyces sp. NRRL F-5755]|nr:hypothetical protein ADK86_12510 [Streptomyces sp. NRRL F-5755]